MAGAVITALVTTPRDAGPSSPAVSPTEPANVRPIFHIVPQSAWLNDPQRPFYLDGRWHLYYLYNADYPHGNGTAWYHVTSTDLVNWQDEGVAIDKYTNGLGDIETGSAVIDIDDTAGFGAGAVIAIMTQQHEGIQRQSLFVSTDGGYSFDLYDGNPVLDNPGTSDFRDPKIIWDERDQQWVMVLAEGAKLGFYTSGDLVDWSYRSAFERDDLGVLECPDLFEMSVDGDPERTVWVLGASAHGAEYGVATGYAYWVGDWSGGAFTTDQQEPQWLDTGADFYAAVTWAKSDVDRTEPLSARYAIGWMNNWAYAGNLPLADWHGGALSVVRELTLVEHNSRLSLRSSPVEALADSQQDAWAALQGVVLPAADTISVAEDLPRGYRLRITVGPDAADPAQEVRLHFVSGDGVMTTIGYDFVGRQAFVVRAQDAAADQLPDEYRAIRTAPIRPADDGRVSLDILVDDFSFEVFSDTPAPTLTSLSFGAGDSRALAIETVGGSAELIELTVTPIPSNG